MNYRAEVNEESCFYFCGHFYYFSKAKCGVRGGCVSEKTFY